MEKTAKAATINPIAAWHTEHVYFNQLLHLLHRQVEAFNKGGQPNYELMMDIVSYLREYSDRVHHPREDVAFALLARRCPEMAPALERLGQEHRIIARAGEELLKALQAILGGVIVRRVDVEVAAATYLVYYGNHIAKEEEDVLARAAKELTRDDWEKVRTAVTPMRDPLFDGEAETRFRELRRQIALES